MRKYIILAALTGLSVMISVSGLVMAGKIHEISPDLLVPASMWLFPFIFVLGNIVTEIYGAAVARWVVVITFSCTIIATLCYLFVLLLPYPEYWQKQKAYQVVLAAAPRIVIASIVAYVMASNVAIVIMSGMKKLTQGRWLWLRIITASAVGMIVDSFLFVGITFWGTVPIFAITSMVVTSSILKFFMQLLGIPISYAVVKLAKEKI